MPHTFTNSFIRAHTHTAYIARTLKHTHTFKHTHTHMQAHTNKHTHTHTHTYAQKAHTNTHTRVCTSHTHSYTHLILIVSYSVLSPMVYTIYHRVLYIRCINIGLYVSSASGRRLYCYRQYTAAHSAMCPPIYIYWPILVNELKRFIECIIRT